MTSVLSVEQLSTSFVTRGRTARAVEEVSFDLAEGETLGVVGESGAGKTVLALSLLKLLPQPPAQFDPLSRVVFQGQNVLELSGAPLRRVRGGGMAMVFQDPMSSLNPVLTAGYQVEEAIRAHTDITPKQARARAVELFGMVGIPDPKRRVHQYPHQLSGGMLQRVMIAMALAAEPRILIADEPTTALDVTIQAQILDLIKDLKQQLGMSLLLISHDLGVMAHLADRVAVMYGGQIVELAPTADLFKEPRHPYTEGLMRAIPRPDAPPGRLATIGGSVPSATRWPPGCRFHPRCAQAWSRCREGPVELERVDETRQVRCWLLRYPDREQG